MTWRSLAHWLARRDHVGSPVQDASPEQRAAAWKAGFLAGQMHLLSDVKRIRAERDYWKARYEWEHTMVFLTQPPQGGAARVH